MVIRYQVFMTNLILTLNLVDDQFGVTIGFKVPFPHLLSEPEDDEQGIVLGYVVGARFC